MVTRLTTNPLVRCLNRAQRTGSLVVSWPHTTKGSKLYVSRNVPPGTRGQSSVLGR